VARDLGTHGRSLWISAASALMHAQLASGFGQPDGPAAYLEPRANDPLSTRGANGHH